MEGYEILMGPKGTRESSLQLGRLTQQGEPPLGG
jgi:hypothetical protein